MCNANNHPPGCACGWGPPYPSEIAGGTVDLSKLPKGNLAAFDIKEIKQIIKNVRNILTIEIKKQNSWVSKILLCVKAGRIVDQALLPKTLNDVIAGDVLLVAPAPLKFGDLTDKAASEVVRKLDMAFSGKKSPASHVVTALPRTRGGEQLYLDHTWEGSRIIGEKEFIRKYGHRGICIARPLALADGRKLLKCALEEAQKPESDFGVRGKNVVCSEKAGYLVAKSTRLPLTKKKRFGPDITPADFYDKRHVGKYFVISPLKK